MMMNFMTDDWLCVQYCPCRLNITHITCLETKTFYQSVLELSIDSYNWYVLKMDFEGLSGRIRFENGRRRDFTLDITELTQQGLKKVGFDYEPRHRKTVFFAYAKTKTQISFADSTIPLHPKTEISSIKPSSMIVQPDLCRTWPETPNTVFSL